MGQLDIGIMSHPAVPVAAADTVGHDPDHNTVLRRNRVGQFLYGDGPFEFFVIGSFHGFILSLISTSRDLNLTTNWLLTIDY